MKHAIARIDALEILDSRGNPTLRVRVLLDAVALVEVQETEGGQALHGNTSFSVPSS